MKTRYVIISAIIFLLMGIAITIISFETIPSELPENLPKGITPIAPVVGKTTTPIGNYMIAVSILVLVGTGIYSLVRFLKRRIRK